jgi:hypothetical protein
MTSEPPLCWPYPCVRYTAWGFCVHAPLSDPRRRLGELRAAAEYIEVNGLAEELCTRPGHACATEGEGPCNGLPRPSAQQDEMDVPYGSPGHGYRIDCGCVWPSFEAYRAGGLTKIWSCVMGDMGAPTGGPPAPGPVVSGTPSPTECTCEVTDVTSALDSGRVLMPGPRDPACPLHGSTGPCERHPWASTIGGLCAMCTLTYDGGQNGKSAALPLVEIRKLFGFPEPQPVTEKERGVLAAIKRIWRNRFWVQDWWF